MSDAPRLTLVERRPDDRRKLANHYKDQSRLAQLEAVLAECVHYIDTTWGAEDDLPEPECAIAAKRLLGWTLG